MPSLDRSLLHRIGCNGQVFIGLLHQFCETRQARGIGDARTAEKHHTSVLVGLQQALGNIWSIGYELH